jgi:predicted RNase H-like HicB family nuclease
MTRKALPVVVWKENRWFVAKTVGLELASQGRNKKEAINNLQEALDLLLEDEIAYV